MWWDEMRWDEPIQTEPLMLVRAQVLGAAVTCIKCNSLQCTRLHFSVCSPTCALLLLWLWLNTLLTSTVNYIFVAPETNKCAQEKSQRESKWFIILLTKSFYYFFPSYVNCYVYEWKLKVRKHEMCNFFIFQSLQCVYLCVFFSE